MKIKLLLLTSIVALASFSCDEKEPEEKMYTLSANPLSLQFESAGNTAQTVSVKAENMSWSAAVDESGQDWITIEYDQTSITVNVSDNDLLEPRTGTIMILPEIQDVKPVEITVSQAEKEAPDAEDLNPEGMITYYGENFLYPTNGTGEWLLNLFTEDSDHEIEWVTFGKDGYWSSTISNGRIISLYLYCNPAEDYFNPSIENGTYTACYEVGTMEPMTFLTSCWYLGTPWPQGSYMSDCSNGEYTDYEIADGKVVLECDGDNYDIYMALTLADGSKVAYNFSGTLKLSILGNPPYYSDLKEDLEIRQEDIQDSYVSMSFPNINFPEITEYEIEFLGDNILVNTHLFAPYSETGIIPDGEYAINVIDSYSDIEAYSAMIGSYNPIMGNAGCYVEIHDGNEGYDFAPMSGGTIKTTHLGEGIYSFEINAVDDNSHNITFSFEGYLTRNDLENL